MSSGTIWGTKILWDGWSFSSISYCDPRNVQNFGKNVVQGCQNCFLPAQIKVLRKFVESGSLVFIIFATWASNYPIVDGKISVGFSKLHLKSLEIRREDCFEKSAFVHHFWISSEKIIQIWCLVEKLRQACQKCDLGVQGNISRKNNFCKKIYICSSWSFLDFRRIFLGNYLSTGVQTAFYVSRWEVWLNFF